MIDFFIFNEYGIIIYMPPRIEDNKRYTINSNGCWIYNMSLSQQTGYGQYHIQSGKNTTAHKYFYEKKYGKVPKGKELDHLCRVRACCNPDHLEVVSHAENGRRGIGVKLYGKIDEIKQLYTNGKKQYALAELFGVNQSQISRIITNVRWN